MDVRGAFVVNVAALEAVEKILRDYAATGPDNDREADVSEEVYVDSKGKPSETFTRVASIAKLRNPKQQAITTLALSVKSNRAEAVAAFDDLGHIDQCAFFVKATALSVDAVSALAGKIDDELKNLRPWYSVLRRVRDSIAHAFSKVPEVLRMLFGLLWIIALMVWLTFTAYSSVRLRDWKEKARQALDAYEDLSVEAQIPGGLSKEVDTLAETLSHADEQPDPLLYLGMAVLLGLLIGLFLRTLGGVLFPRVVFEIGEGIQRHEHVRWFRRFVIWSIVLGGIVLPWLRSRLM